MADDPKAATVHELLPFTRWTIVDMDPVALERVAAYLEALMGREPIKSGKGWVNELIVLGCLVTDLQSMVSAAGEPIGVQRDLRDARTKAEELDARHRAELAFRAFDNHITDAIESDRAAWDAQRPMEHPQEEPDDQPPAHIEQLSPASAPVLVTPAAEPLPDDESVPWL